MAFFFCSALRPQKPYGLQGTGEEKDGEGMRAQVHLPVHTALELREALYWSDVHYRGR